MYEVRGKDKDRLEHDLQLDLVSRTSIQWREARHFGWERDTVFVHLQGEETSLKVADEAILRYGRVPANADALHQRLLWEDDAGAASLGRVMGNLPPPAFKPSEAEKRKEVVAKARTTAVVAKAKAETLWSKLRARLKRR